MNPFKKSRKIRLGSMTTGIMILILVVAVFVSACSFMHSNAKDSGDGKKLSIVFTHDLHSYLTSYKAFHDGEVQQIGGVARLSTLIKQIKSEKENVLLVDGGDMAVGTLYQTLYATDAIELRMLGILGFDATTFGNHDFDYETDKLTQMFNSAAALSEIKDNSTLPAFTVCNINWDYDNDDTRNIKKAVDKCNYCEYAIIEKGDVKIGVFGLFGKEAHEDSPMLRLDIKDQIQSAKETVNKIKTENDVDMIVCISHSGTSDNPKKSEDEQLAMAVPDIDVIVSAHSHTLYTEPKLYGNTYIVCCGCYGEYTGLVDLTQTDDKRWVVEDYSVISMTSDIDEDPEIVKLLDGYDEVIDAEYLASFGYTRNQVIAVNDYNFESVDDMYFDHTEHNLGNIMSDAYRYAVNNTQDGKLHPADISVVPSGTVRGTFLQGEITTETAFESYSLGIGFDDIIGFPLVQFYLTGDEVKLIPEVDASLSPIMNSAVLYCSGISYTIGNNRMFLNKAYNISLNPEVMDDKSRPVEDDRLYCVVTDLYTARMLGSVSRLSHGLIKIIPKKADGSVVESDENGIKWEQVVAHEDDGSELKTWVAIASYLQSFEKNEEGISVIPEYYSVPHDRKIINDEKSLKLFFTETNKYFWMISGVVVGVVVVIVLVVLCITSNIRKKKHSNAD